MRDEGFGYETMFIVQAAPTGRRSTSTASATTSSRSASPCWSPATPGRSRSTSTTSGRTRSSRYGARARHASQDHVENLDNQAERRPRGAGGRVRRRVRRRRRRRRRAHVDERRRAEPTALPIKPTRPAIVAVRRRGDGPRRRSSRTSASTRSSTAARRQPEHRRAARGRPPRPRREVLLLPNNPNVRLAARAGARGLRRPAPRRRPDAQRRRGLRRALALDPDADAAANAGPMTAAGRAIQSVQVTEAVRDATIGGKKVKQGQTIALDPDDGLVAVARRPRQGGPRGGRGVRARASS